MMQGNAAISSAAARTAVFALAWALALGCGLLPAGPGVAHAQSSPGSASTETGVTIDKLTVGFGGVYKVGVWTPVEVELVAGSQAVSGNVVLATPDVDDVMTEVSTPGPIALEPGQRTKVRLFTRFGAVQSVLRATFVPVDSSLPSVSRQWDYRLEGANRLPAAISSQQSLIVGVGPDIGLKEMAAMHRRADGQSRLSIAQLPDAGSLPEAWYGYEGVDWLVLGTSDEAVVTSLNAAQLTALKRWVELGGRLVILSGRATSAVLASDQPLKELAPARWTGQFTTLRRSAELENYVGEVVDPLLAPGGELDVPLLQVENGVVEVQQANAPLIIRAGRGFGEVVVVALDLDQPPVAEWQSRDRFLSVLLGMSARGSRESAREGGGRISHSGITDLSGQLQGALDQFRGVSYVPFVIIALLVLAYILLIGPGDYLFVRKVVRRMPATWVTFPLLVIVSSVAAYAFANWTKGDRLRLNQVDLVDFDLATSRVRGTTWAHVFSPAMATFDMTIAPNLANGEPAPDNTPKLMAWMGTPGPVLGGMDRTSEPAASYGSYRFTPELNAMQGVPIPIWASKGVVGRWHGDDRPPIRVELKASITGVPEGIVTNLLDVPLENCLLAYDRWAFSLPTIQPGQTIRLDRRSEHRELRDELTGRRTERGADDKIRDYRREYDRLSLDIPSILQQMMFYEASGGLTYAGIYHRYQPFTDLSRQLALKRGVLMGFVQRPGAKLVLQTAADGSPAAVDLSQIEVSQHWTCYRVLFDVEGR